MIPAMMNSLFGGWLSKDLKGRHAERLRLYAARKASYDGSIGRLNTTSRQQVKKVKYNLVQPIINTGADFLASRPIQFQVDNDGDALGANPEGAKKAQAIWTRSGAEASFSANAITGSIYGDSCLMIARRDSDDAVYLKWLDASWCFPYFDPHDVNKILKLDIAYTYDDINGKVVNYMETWADGKVIIRENDKVIKEDTYDVEMFDNGVPAVWIRNLFVAGETWGRSDVDVIADLVEEYDHANTKMGRINDYYANPNIYMKGIRKPEILTKGERTIYFLPENGDIGFVEWKGTPQSVDKQLDRQREAISEMSATPQIAFGKIDLQNSDVSGVALRMLYGPLLSKTGRKRMSWGTAIIKAMQYALRVEGLDVMIEKITILWPFPLPNNTKEEWDIAAIKDTLGVPHSQILSEQGYTEEQIAQMAEDKKSQEESAIELQQKANPDPATDPGGRTGFRQSQPPQSSGQ